MICISDVRISYCKSKKQDQHNSGGGIKCDNIRSSNNSDNSDNSSNSNNKITTTTLSLWETMNAAMIKLRETKNTTPIPAL